MYTTIHYNTPVNMNSLDVDPRNSDIENFVSEIPPYHEHSLSEPLPKRSIIIFSTIFNVLM